MGDELTLLLEVFHKIEKAGGQASLSVTTVGGNTKMKLEIATTPVPPTESSSTSSPTGRHHRRCGPRARARRTSVQLLTLLPWPGSYQCSTAQCVLCKVRCHCIFYDAVSDTIRRRGWYRAIITEEEVDTVTYFEGNRGPRVWKSLKLKKVYFPRTRTSWDKYMFNRIVFIKI